MPNRDLLIEFCEGNSLLVANTFLEGEAVDKATYMEPGASRAGAVTEGPFNLLGAADMGFIGTIAGVPSNVNMCVESDLVNLGALKVTLFGCLHDQHRKTKT